MSEESAVKFREIKHDQIHAWEHDSIVVPDDLQEPDVPARCVHLFGKVTTGCGVAAEPRRQVDDGYEIGHRATVVIRPCVRRTARPPGRADRRPES